MKQDDTLAGNEERHVHRFNLTLYHDAVPLKTFDIEDALVKTGGGDESRIPYNLQRLATRKEGSPLIFDSLSRHCPFDCD
jgi:hypothetical protein